MKFATITRTFSLHPTHPQKGQVYTQLKEHLLKFRDLENTYISLLIRALRNGQLELQDFSGESKAFIKSHIYNALNLNRVVAPSFKSYEVKERMKRCAIQYPYFAVRQWLIRTHHLATLARVLSELFQKKKAHILTFLRGRSFSRTILNHMRGELQKDCFGNKTSLSYFFITNMIRQLKNLLISAELLEPHLKQRIRDISSNKALLQTFCTSCLNAFSRKKKGKTIRIPLSELIPYILTRYFAAVKRSSTWNAKKQVPPTELEAFKRRRKEEFLPIIAELRAKGKALSINDVRALLTRLFSEFLKERGSSPDIKLVNSIFKPTFTSPKVGLKPSYEGFQSYLRKMLKNKLKDNLKELFLTKNILKTLTGVLDTFHNTMYEIVPPPKIKSLAVPINQSEQVYEPDFRRLTVKLSFVPRCYHTFSILDDKERLREMLARGACPSLPVLKMEGKKILLHVPFDVKRKPLSKPSSSPSPSPSSLSSTEGGAVRNESAREEGITMGVDLGVRYPAVLSIMDRSDPKKPRELARYFLSTRTLLDMKFNTNNGRFEPRGRFANPISNTPSNQKLKLRRLRRETRHIQQKLHEYKNRCQKRGITRPEEKYKYNSLKRRLSGLWERIRHCNEELIHLLNHVILELATYHKVSEIHFENLKWSRHSRKSKAGKYLAFWQTHWFFSQVQEAIKLQAFLHRIRFKRVNAAYTSKTCSECGERGRVSGKLFTCGNTKSHRRGRVIELQSDLNAARNIALA